MRKFNVNVNGKSYSVEVDEVTDGASVTPVIASVSAAAQADAPKAAPSAPSAAPAPVAGGNANAVKSPLPGMVLKLLAANGAKVKKGDKIIILEAMKMENEIVSPFDGAISYAVAQGANVATGDTLCTVS